MALQAFILKAEHITLVEKKDLSKHAPGRHNQQSHAGGRGSKDFGPVYQDLGTFMYEYDNKSNKPTIEEQDKISKSQEAEWTPEQVAVFAEYQGSGYAINDHLREGYLDSGLRQEVRVFDEAFDMAPSLGEDVIVYRGVKTSYSDREQAEAAQGFFGDLEEGDVFSDGAFASTTLNPRIAAHFGGLEDSVSSQGIVLRINVPKTSKGIFMNSIAKRSTLPNAGRAFNSEYEFLLPRNSKFQLLRKEGKVWDVEVVNE